MRMHVCMCCALCHVVVAQVMPVRVCVCVCACVWCQMVVAQVIPAYVYVCMLCVSPIPYKGCSRGPKLGTYSDRGLSSVLAINKHLSRHHVVCVVSRGGSPVYTCICVSGYESICACVYVSYGGSPVSTCRCVCVCVLVCVCVCT